MANTQMDEAVQVAMPFSEGSLAEISETLAGLPDEQQETYLVRMWHYAVDMAPLLAAEVPKNENCDAVPYMPSELEERDIALSNASCVLDVGCLGGYGLFDLAGRRARAGLPVPKLIGVDVDQQSVELGRRLSGLWGAPLDLEIKQGKMEDLPVGNGSCDLVIARLVLPYCDIGLSLSELSRVLKPGGAFLVQLHAPRYYLRRFASSLRRPLAAVYYARPLISGMLLAAFSWQSSSPRWSECALSPSNLNRLARQRDLQLVWSGGSKIKPLALFKLDSGCSPEAP
jgi:SAM-dependent methyltransferase